jgi:uncharacterized protein
MSCREPARVLRNVMVAMRDGVRLATDVYLPAGTQVQAFPVLLERTPYGKTVDSPFEHSAADQTLKSRAAVAQFFVDHGYAVVYQDCRGRYDSEGMFVKYVHEPDDGYDTCAWVVRQPWCAGRIGTFGLSYAAHTQVHLASAGAPGLAAMFVDSGGFSNAHQGGVRQGGAYELKQALWCFANAQKSPDVVGDPPRLAALQQQDIRAWLKDMPWRRGHSPVSLAPQYEEYLFDQWERGSFDAYWRQIAFWGQGFHDRFRGTPVVFMSGHYDIYARAATDNFQGLSRGESDRKVRLILGPWTHGGRSATHSGDVDFGPAAPLDGNLAPDYLHLRLRWFDRWLKEAQDGDDPQVMLFVMGGGSGRRNADGRLDHGGQWRAERTWPIRETRWTSYFLHPAGLLSPHGAPERIGYITYDFDPARPVPTIGGAVANGEPLMFQGGFDQRESEATFGSEPPYRALENRPDVLVFRTLPLEEDLEVIGAITVTLWVASDCMDTDFTAKLIDEYPPNEDYPEGYALNIADGIIRARYRDSLEAPALLTPSVVTRVQIETFPTSNNFQRGHRIRLDISSSNFPHFDANPNTGEPEGRATRLKIARNEIHFGQSFPSCVQLPVIPARA